LQVTWALVSCTATAKDGECPAEMKGPTRPPQAYCLSDESCPGNEKCCSQAGQIHCGLFVFLWSVRRWGVPETASEQGLGRLVFG
uniref:WAP domain-containing protein n=1 Tax=Gopherus evgoodei TaxID=1825980 RepID=A0A8C4VZC5_9SAUR